MVLEVFESGQETYPRTPLAWQAWLPWRSWQSLERESSQCCILACTIQISNLPLSYSYVCFHRQAAQWLQVRKMTPFPSEVIPSQGDESSALSIRKL